MAEITTETVKELRERTGAGMLDCKKALKETDGDVEQAIAYLRKKGLAAAAKKAGRVATEGAVVSYIHPNHRIGVLLEVNCETDFVASNPDFRAFCSDVAMQIAAMAPEVVRPEDLDATAIETERAVLRERAIAEGKPERSIDSIVDGQIRKYVSERALLGQKFVKDDKKTVGELLTELVARLGENIQIRRFVRFELGEGLARKEENFAEEVAKQIAASGR